MTDTQKSPQQNAREIVLNIFPELMMGKEYQKISVQDILKRAHIGRTTFYAHFTSKEDVLKGSTERLRDSLIRAVANEHPTNIKRGRIAFSLHFFKHIISHHKLYDDMVGRDVFMLERYILKILTTLVGTELFEIPHTNEQRLKIELMTQHLVGAIRTTSKWWMERKQLSAEDVNDYFKKMALPGLEETLTTL
jgi:AcrR family transcriptional regulator